MLIIIKLGGGYIGIYFAFVYNFVYVLSFHNDKNMFLLLNNYEIFSQVYCCLKNKVNNI